MVTQATATNHNISNLTVNGYVLAGLQRRRVADGTVWEAQVIRHGQLWSYQMTADAWGAMYAIVTEYELFSEVWSHDGELYVTLDTDAKCQWLAGQVAAPDYDEGPAVDFWAVL